MAEWQFILYFMVAVLSGGFLMMFVIPRIEKWLIKFNKDLERYVGKDLENKK
jgi:hypothetical protein